MLGRVCGAVCRYVAGLSDGKFEPVPSLEKIAAGKFSAEFNAFIAKLQAA